MKDPWRELEARKIALKEAVNLARANNRSYSAHEVSGIADDFYKFMEKGQ